jgi:hypothetical protein
MEKGKQVSGESMVAYPKQIMEMERNPGEEHRAETKKR